MKLFREALEAFYGTHEEESGTPVELGVAPPEPPEGKGCQIPGGKEDNG
jgi:hypothetical protein